MTPGETAYPNDWADIALKVKQKAGFKCENCGHPDAPRDGYTLTVHHINGDKANNAYWNLAALCQRCHLSIQARFSPGQLPLLDSPRWLRRHLSGFKGRLKKRHAHDIP